MANIENISGDLASLLSCPYQALLISGDIADARRHHRKRISGVLRCIRPGRTLVLMPILTCACLTLSP